MGVPGGRIREAAEAFGRVVILVLGAGIWLVAVLSGAAVGAVLGELRALRQVREDLEAARKRVERTNADG